MKKMRVFLILTIMLFLTGCAGTTQSMGNNGIPDETQLEAALAELGEDEESLMLSVNGKVYQFPMEMQTLLDDGWKLDSSVASQFKTIPGKTRTTTFLVNLKGADGYNSTKLHVVVSNNINMELKLGEVKVYSMNIDKAEGSTIILPQGITWESTFDEVMAAYEPDGDHVVNKSDMVYIIVVNPDTYHQVRLDFDPETKVLIGLKYTAHF